MLHAFFQLVSNASIYAIFLKTDGWSCRSLAADSSKKLEDGKSLLAEERDVCAELRIQCSEMQFEEEDAQESSNQELEELKASHEAARIRLQTKLEEESSTQNAIEAEVAAARSAATDAENVQPACFIFRCTAESRICLC